MTLTELEPQPQPKAVFHFDAPSLRCKLADPTTASFIAGGFAGAISRTVVSPFERMKIIFQVQGPGSTAYQGVWPTLKKMYREEGWKGMFRGNGSNCIRIVPYSAVQFATYSVMKSHLLAPGEKELDTVRRLVAGGVAGVVCCFATYPLDLVRTRLSIQTASLSNMHSLVKPPGLWSLMAQIYRTEGGVVGLYKGLVPTTLGVAPYVALNFAAYEYIKEFSIKGDKTREVTNVEKLLYGGISGGIAQTLTYPFDLLRRRFQVLHMGAATGREGELGFHYRGTLHALKCIFRDEGLRGAYKGLSANLLKVVPAMASSWLSYEVIKDFLLDLD